MIYASLFSFLIFSEAISEIEQNELIDKQFVCSNERGITAYSINKLYKEVYGTSAEPFIDMGTHSNIEGDVFIALIDIENNGIPSCLYTVINHEPSLQERFKKRLESVGLSTLGEDPWDIGDHYNLRSTIAFSKYDIHVYISSKNSSRYIRSGLAAAVGKSLLYCDSIPGC